MIVLEIICGVITALCMVHTAFWAVWAFDNFVWGKEDKDKH